MAISEEKPKLQRGFIHSSFFSSIPFLSCVSGTILLSSMEIAVRHISFGQVRTKPNRDQAIFWSLRVTKKSGWFGTLYVFIYLRILSSQILWITAYIHMVFIGTLLEVIGVKLSCWLFSVMELKYLSEKPSAHLQESANSTFRTKCLDILYLQFSLLHMFCDVPKSESSLREGPTSLTHSNLAYCSSKVDHVIKMPPWFPLIFAINLEFTLAFYFLFSLISCILSISFLVHQ